MTAKIRSTVYLAVFLGSLTVAQGFLGQSEELGQTHHLTQDHSRDTSSPDSILISSLLGGLRGIFMTGLWLHADRLRLDGQYFEMVDVYKLITRLQPGHTNAWAFLAWDMSYNIAQETGASPEEKSYWVFRGLNFLRLHGIPLNPKSPDLQQELAWLFFHKIGDETDGANFEYKRRLQEEIVSTFGIHFLDEDVLERMSRAKSQYQSLRQFKQDPRYRKIEARIQAIAPQTELFRDAPKLMLKAPEKLSVICAEAEVKEFLETLVFAQLAWRAYQRLGLDVTKMLEITRWHGLGPIDWRLPQAQALYWARSARKLHKQLYAHDSSMKDQYILNHALMKLVAGGDAVRLGNGTLLCVPNYPYLEPAVAIIREALEEFQAISDKEKKQPPSRSPTESMREGFKNFLISMALNAYLDGHSRAVKKMQEHLFNLTADLKYQSSMQDFIASELATRLETIQLSEAQVLIQTFYSAACNQLASGGWQFFERRNFQITRIYQQVRQNAEQKYASENRAVIDANMPPLVELKRRSVMLILARRMPNFKDNQQGQRAKALLRYLQQVDPELTKVLRKQAEKRRQLAPRPKAQKP